MTDKEIKRFIKDRHKAFSAVLYNEDIEAMRKYCKKYMMTMPDNKIVVIGGVCKAVQECTDFSDKDKVYAFNKALEYGFYPFME